LKKKNGTVFAKALFVLGKKKYCFGDLIWVPLKLFSKFLLEEEKIYRPHTAFASQ